MEASARARSLFGWRRAMAYTLLWATAVSALENVAPISFFNFRQTVSMAVTSMATWALSGAILLTFAKLALPRLRPVPLMAAAVLLLSLLGLGYEAVTQMLFIVGPWLVRFGPVKASLAHLIWIHLLYGGVFIAGAALAHRAERTRTILAQAEIARSRSETLLSQAQLASLEGSVDPGFLLRVMRTMQIRYAEDAPGADRLLDQLVGFLRLAMPGVRSGRSTLGAELAIVRSYSRLLCDLEPQRKAWSCDVDASLADLPFPPLLLVPLLDRLSVASNAGDGVALTSACGTTHALLSIRGNAMLDGPGHDLLHRLRVGLHAAYGAATHVVLSAAELGRPALLTISLPLAAGVQRGGDGSVPFTNGDASCQPIATTTN